MNKANRKPRTRTKPATSVAPFLHKIYEILENPVHNDLISWNEEGTAFLIKNVTEFTEKVLPKYFKHNNFASFVRQLNLYDFHKSRYENNGSEFYHKLFKRNEKHLLSEIKRKMPNDGGSDSPPQYQGMQEEMGMENIVPISCQGDAGLQNLINRQDQLENAMKMVFTENKRLSKENKLLWTEVTSLKNKQMNTEKATKTINTQNTQLLKENRCLWSELIMNKEKFERQIEKLLVLLFSIAQHSGKTPSNLFKKKTIPTTRGTTGNEEEDGAWATPDANNNYSVMPAKTFNKKGKTQLDKILEHFEEEGLGTLFGNKPFVVEEKDWMRLSSFLDVETGGSNNNNLQSLEFFNDKRPPQIDTSFEKEDPRDTFSKMCKIEYDQNVPTIVEEKNFIEVPNSPNLDRFLKPEKLFDITNSPVPLEKAMNELELSPVAAKGRSGIFEYDVVHGPETCFLQLQKNPSFFQGNFLEEEFENENQQQEDKRDISYFMNRSFGLGKSRGSSQIDLSGKGEPKFDEVMHFFNTHQLNNSNHEDKNNDSFHNSFFNLSGMNMMHNDPNP